ncbi:DNA-binding protein [Undibacterium arcticum]
MDTAAATEKNSFLQTSIACARSFTQTQDLYREVCVLLFFRYGMTPTANKLYQLVRKGSMTAPAEALNKFWEDLREKEPRADRASGSARSAQKLQLVT